MKPVHRDYSKLDGIISEQVAEPPKVMIRTRKKTIVPRSVVQTAYMEALARDDMIFALGPAGTGKTYLAVAMAVTMLLSGRADRIILSRPAVEAGERLGFLPGDMKDKVDPYLRPLYDALQDMLPDGKLAARLESGHIEVAPLAFMRGRTLADAFVILDEARHVVVEREQPRGREQARLPHSSAEHPPVAAGPAAPGPAAVPRRPWTEYSGPSTGWGP